MIIFTLNNNQTRTLNSEKFRRLQIDNITPYFERDIQDQLLRENPVRVIDRLVRKQVKFLSEHSGKPESSRRRRL
jgi:hypothetical protein